MIRLPVRDCDAPPSSARIYQVELSSYCNMQCAYCPHPGMKRQKGHMTSDVLSACIDWIKETGGRRIVLHHFGEPLLHPRLKERIEQVADSGLEMQLSTNALLLDRAWPTLTSVQARIAVMVSVHQWIDGTEDAYLAAIERWRRQARGTNIDILEAYNLKEKRFTLHQWAAGQASTWDASQCLFVRCNLCVVLWNGDIATCCVDHEGATARFNIMDQRAHEHVSRVWNACDRCDVGRILRHEEW